MPASSRSVASLPLPPTIRHQLLLHGFSTTADLAGINPDTLCQEGALTPAQAQQVLEALGTPAQGLWGLPGAQSAADIFSAEQHAACITTSSPEVDAVLGGGVSTGRVTELCGVPGVGKTQLGMQLAVNVQLPAVMGGLEGQAIYLDTEGSFMVQRAVDMVQGALQAMHHTAANNMDHQLMEMAAKTSMEQLLEGILYFRIHHYGEQLAVIHLLPMLLEQHPRVKLMVIDSVTFHFRQDFHDMAARTRILTQMAQDLMKIAEHHHVAVVLVNQVTTRVLADNRAQLVPALGESWGHAASTRVILQWQGDRRYAQVIKSPSEPPGTAEYCVTSEGIRSPQSFAMYQPGQQDQGLEKRVAPFLPPGQPTGSRPRLQE